MRVLVTGGAGFIGSFITDGLVWQNHGVRRCFADSPKSAVAVSNANEAALRNLLTGV